MSTPLNVLSKYRSYSYYHVLAICDRSVTAEALSTSTDLSVWEHNHTNNSLGIYGPKDIKIPPGGFSYIVDGNDTGRYCILINGATNANFVITDAKWVGSTAAEATVTDKGTSCAIEGSLNISEPRGILFVDRVIECCLSLGIDTANAVWVLKTFFIGYEINPDTDKDQVSTISDVTPVQFLLSDLTGTYTVEGGVYDLQWIACTNGAGRLPQYSKAVDKISILLSNGTDNTLEAAMNKLTLNINQNYQSYSTCVKSYIDDRFPSSSTTSIKESDRYYDVEYQIELDTPYKDNKYVISDQPSQYTNGPGCNESAYFKPSPSMNIEDAIRTIMGMCPQIKEDMQKGTTDDKRRYEYRIIPSIMTVSVAGNEAMKNIKSNKLKGIIKYQIRRFPVPKDLSYELVTNTGASDNKGQDIAQYAQENLIVFDYIYSGKNIDILEFDIKLNLGYAYLQTASVSNTFAQQHELLPKRSIQISPKDNDSSTRYNQKTQVPIFFGSIVQSPNVNNTKSHNTSAASAYTLANHSSLELSEASIKIVGNPRMLGSINRASGPIGTTLTKPLHIDLAADPTSVVFPHFTTVPTLAKVNIYMPSSDDDLTVFEQRSQDYKQQFWFKGFYYVYIIENEFIDGQFTQTLKMLGIPDRTILQDSKATTGISTFGESLKDCYEGGVDNETTGTVKSAVSLSSGIPSSASGVVGVDFTGSENAPPAEQSQGAKTLDEANAVDQLQRNPTDVKKWEEAIPSNLRDAILNAAAVKNVSAKTLAQLCYVESKLGANTVSTSSTARGPFQFIEKTWLDLTDPAISVRVIGLDTTTLSRDAKLALRNDPNYSALAAAQYMSDNRIVINSNLPGDLYLAHFLGPEDAKLVIAADNQGFGTSLLSTVIKKTDADRAVLHNPFLKTFNPTAGYPTAFQVRFWAALVMSAALKQGVPGAVELKTISEKVSGSSKRTAKQNVAITKDATQQKQITTPCDGDKIPKAFSPAPPNDNLNAGT